MKPSDGQAKHGRKPVIPASVLLLLGALLIGATPVTGWAVPIYESAVASPPGLLGDGPDENLGIVQNQSLGVKFHVSTPVTTGSIGGYFAELTGGIDSDITGAIVRLHGPHDFPDSFAPTSDDVLGTTRIRVSDVSDDFAGNLSLRLTGGWYALVFSATGVQDSNAAVMPGVHAEIEDPLYFFGRTTGATGAFEYLDGGGLDGIRMFVDSAPTAPVPEPSTLVLLASGLAGLGGIAWRRGRS